MTPDAPRRAAGRDGRGRMPGHRIEIRGTATPDEAAAIAAAIERFLRDTATTPARAPDSPWLRAGLLEQAGLAPDGPGRWGDPVPWGRRQAAAAAAPSSSSR